MVLTHNSKKNIPWSQDNLLPCCPVIDAHMAFIRPVVWDPYLWEPVKKQTNKIYLYELKLIFAFFATLILQCTKKLHDQEVRICSKNAKQTQINKTNYHSFSISVVLSWLKFFFWCMVAMSVLLHSLYFHGGQDLSYGGRWTLKSQHSVRYSGSSLQGIGKLCV